jgi:hypothetical protein
MVKETQRFGGISVPSSAETRKCEPTVVGPSERDSLYIWAAYRQNLCLNDPTH